jgi:predicted transcriptional regulator
MLNNMKSEAPADTLVPPDLLAEIQAAAAEEHRAPSDLVGEAIERYLSERRWFRKDEVHTKIAQGLESLRQGQGLDGETVMAELIAELDASEHTR